jgi:hypothetical protein
MKRRHSATLLPILLLACSPEVQGPVNSDDFGDGVDLTSHRIFISSTTSNGLMGTTGLTGADTICTDLARSAGLKRQYRALLSTSAIDVKNRFTSTAALYAVGPSGSYRVTSNLNANLITVGATLDAAISHTELLLAPSGIRAWTGSNSVGAHSTSCSDWTSASVGLGAVTGLFAETDKDWLAGGGAPNCSNALHIYCVSAAWNGNDWVF